MNYTEDDEVGNFSEEDDLMESITPAVRLFVLGDLERTILVGAVLGEGDDSFLVAVPLVQEKQGMNTYFKAPFIRLLKSQIQSVLPAVPELHTAYIQFLKTQGYTMFPEYVSGLQDALQFELGVRKAVVEGRETFPSDIEGLLSEAEDRGLLITDNDTVH